MEQQEYPEEENNQVSTPEESFSGTIKNRKGNTKRFSDEQVKLLESVFSGGAKLEPRKKLQLARDIGLQPRQVSIWFQNKRARWKTKQLEHEYRLLKSKFDSLYEQYESLKREKENLSNQFNTLTSMLDKRYNKKNNSSKNQIEDVRIRDGIGDQIYEVKEKNEDMMYYEDEEQKVVNTYLRKEAEDQVVTFCGDGESWLASDEQRGNLVPGCLLDEPCCPSNWWDL